MRKEAEGGILCRVTCEACGERYEAARVIKEVGGGMSNVGGRVAGRCYFAKQLILLRVQDPHPAADDTKSLWLSLDDNMRRICSCTDGDIPRKACPKCGYVQSWMQLSWQHHRQLIYGFVLAIPLTLPVAFAVLRWSGPAGWAKLLILGVTYIVLCGPGWYLFKDRARANRNWRPEGRSPEGTRIAPEVVS